jgi:hypothetical protein
MVQFMDLCEKELSQLVDQLEPARLDSLLGRKKLILYSYSKHRVLTPPPPPSQSAAKAGRKPCERVKYTHRVPTLLPPSSKCRTAGTNN